MRQEREASLQQILFSMEHPVNLNQRPTRNAFEGNNLDLVIRAGAKVGVIIDDKGRFLNSPSFLSVPLVQVGSLSTNRNLKTGISNPRLFNSYQASTVSVPVDGYSPLDLQRQASLLNLNLDEYTEFMRFSRYVIVPNGTRVHRQIHIQGSPRTEIIPVTDKMSLLSQLLESGAVYIGEN